ncbi:MobF family relaxase [Pseudonocardia sp. ICBG162]|uniref:MobF family relaxase n=1 Tax=Pseudonocardia sp. ICBG162 TaxID=2846761 RepID=UPI001CF61002|nr:MobF family relaxase [Pseudonocardia sp. ICBG162]
MAVVRVTAVSAGAVEYLIKGSGCVDHEQAADLDAHAAAHAGIDYQLREVGEPAGRWLGSGLSMIGVEEGAVATEDDVRAVFGRLEQLAPKDAHGLVQLDADGNEVRGDPLGRRPRTFVDPEKRAERAAARARARDPQLSPEREAAVRARALVDDRKPVAYYDVTFSPDKSVSVYWAALHAAGDTERADAVAAAHDAAVREAAAYLEQHVAYTRGGRGNVAVASVQEYQRAEGLVMIPFRHSTSRENEPQLHTHLAVLNRVVSLVDGKIRALDGRGFAPVKQAASVVYERALARGVRAATGAVMELRTDGVSRRIVGVDEELCRAGSTRRGDVEDQVAEWAEQYRRSYGREPTDADLREMTQAAVFKTRPAKHGPGGPDGFREWSDEQGDRLTAMVGQVADAAAGHVAAPLAGVAADGRVDWPAAIRAGVGDVQAEYATWQLGELIRRVDAHLPEDIGSPAGVDRKDYLHQQVAAVLADGAAHQVVALGPGDAVSPPPELAGPDGRSVFRPYLHGDRYATAGQLAAERRVVAATRTDGAPMVAGVELELLRVELAAAGLGGDQVEAVAGIMASGRRVDVLIGAAGTGKSHAMGELARVWEERTGGRVLGLATSQNATDNLREDGLEAQNTRVFRNATRPDEHGRVRYPVRSRDLVIVDEAGMSSTDELDEIMARVTGAGGKVLLTGDHHQLTSVGAGGILAQLVDDAPGSATRVFELTEVRRFENVWEREASLGLRVGDPSAVAAYADHGRLRGGTAQQMQDAACRGWLADTLAGRESLLIVRSNDDASKLSKRLHDELVAYGRVAPEVIARDADGNPLGVGDVVQARRNDWSQRIDPAPDARPGSPVGRVTNREIYIVVGPDPATPGGLLVRRADGATAHLTPDYLREWTHLAYASTVHAAQGRTVDTGHNLVDQHATREDTYTAATRGRSQNTLYLETRREPDEHQPERLRRDARTALARAVAGQSLEPTAEQTRRAGEQYTRSLAWIGGQWDQIHTTHARARYEDLLADRLDEHAATRVADEAGHGRLLRAVRSAELAGHQPERLLDEVTVGGLADAHSVSDVLRYRIRRALAEGRDPEQRAHTGDWTTLAAPLDGPAGQWAHELARAAGDRQAELGEAAAIDQPAWTAGLGPVPDPVTEPAARAAWEQRAGVVAGYRELAGIDDDQLSLGQPPSRENPLGRALYQQAAETLGYRSDPAAGDVRVLDDGELYAIRDRWTREQAWAPEWVADELAETYRTAAEAQQEADLAAARLAQLEPGTGGRAWNLDRYTAATATAQAYLERATQLEEIHRARAGWAEITADTEAADREAAAELERRGLPLQRVAEEPEQLGLFPGPAPEQQEQPAEAQPVVAATTDTDAKHDATRDEDAAVRSEDDPAEERSADQLSLIDDMRPSLAEQTAAGPVRDAPIDRDPAARDDEVPTESAADDDSINPDDDVWRPEDRHHRADAPTVDVPVDRIDHGREVDDQAFTLGEARRQARAADGQRAARGAAALERGLHQQASAAIAAQNAEQAHRETVECEATERACRVEATTAPEAQRETAAPRIVRAPGSN